MACLTHGCDRPDIHLLPHPDRYPIEKPAAIALAPARRANSPLRLKTDFLNRIKLIWAVQSLPQKYFCFPEPQIKSISIAVSPQEEGRIMIVAYAGWDAMDASRRS
jgi:hypothetical protein